MLCVTVLLCAAHTCEFVRLAARRAACSRVMNGYPWQLCPLPAGRASLLPGDSTVSLQTHLERAAVGLSVLQSLVTNGPLIQTAKKLSQSRAQPINTAATMHARGTKRHTNWKGSGPQDQKRARSEQPGRSASVHPISTPPNNCDYEQLTQKIVKYYERTHQTQSTFTRKMRLRDALYAVMKGVFPYCGLYVVGSSLNSFGNNTSDMDLCLMLCHHQIDQKKEATEILQILCKALRKCTFLKQVLVIRAKVPILKFTDDVSGIECDLNVNNAVGIRNTHLLNAYANLEPRVGQLVLFLKHWGKVHNINDAKTGTISSYSLVLMLIHYLQCGVNPPVLPSLQQIYPHKFDRDMDIRLLSLNESLPEYTSPNKQSAGELFVGFLHYYAHVFDFEANGMSVRLSCTMPKEKMAKQDVLRNPPAQWKCLCIEEPFDLSNTARSVYDHYTFMRILRVFRQSYQTLSMTGDVDSILQHPL